MAVCLFKQTLGTKPKKLATARIRIGNVLTPPHKQEMDFQNLSRLMLKILSKSMVLSAREVDIIFFSVLSTLFLSNTNSGISLQQH